MSERRLRVATIVFAVAVLLHVIDHVFLRGMNGVPWVVMVFGYGQFAATVITLLLVLRGYRRAAWVALVVSFVTVVSFSASHLLPPWCDAISDSFINAPPMAGISAYSWITLIAELVTGVVLVVVAAMVLRSRR